MKNYWHNLNSREQYMLIGAGIICLLYISYAWLFSPIMAAANEQKRLFLDKQATLQWMQHQPLPKKSLAKHLSANQLLAVLATQLNTSNMQRFPYHLQQTGTGDIQLSFDAVPYNQLMHWLWTMHEQYALSVKQMDIARGKVAGIVKWSVIITIEK